MQKSTKTAIAFCSSEWFTADEEKKGKNQEVMWKFYGR